MKNLKFFIILTVLLLSGIVGYKYYFTQLKDSDLTAKMSDFPREIGEWKSRDIPMGQRVYELLETDNLIMREYIDKQGNEINFYIIYAGDNRKVAHPPEICLQGDGMAVLGQTKVKVTDSIEATQLILEKQNIKQMAVYWYKTGKYYTHDYLDQQLRVSANRLLGKQTSLALIRVITSIKDNDQAKAFNKIQAFCFLLQPLLDQYVP